MLFYNCDSVYGLPIIATLTGEWLAIYYFIVISNVLQLMIDDYLCWDQLYISCDNHSFCAKVFGKF